MDIAAIWTWISKECQKVTILNLFEESSKDIM
jgi:hypothetical protein